MIPDPGKNEAIIGINDWEKDHPQDIIINVEIRLDGSRAAKSDAIGDTVNYKAIKKNILDRVESTHFGLLEKLAFYILKIIHEDDKVQWASVEVDKPHALRFADSVSVTATTDELS